MSGCRRLGVFLGLMMAASISVASEEIPLEDFAAEMSAVGVPDLSMATWIRIEQCWEPRRENIIPYEWPLKGNGWMLSESRDEAGTPLKGAFVVNGNEVIDLAWGESGHRGIPGLPELLAAPVFGPNLKGQWREIDLKLDIRQVLRFLKSLEGEDYPATEIKEDRGARIALFVVGLWQQGEKKVAEEMWGRLATGPGAGTNLLRSTKLLAANGEYENLCRRFRAEHDWVAYRDGIRRLLDKAPEGWRKARALRELLLRVEKRLEHPEPLPAVTNGFTAEDFELAARMLKVRASHVQRRHWGEPFFSWMIPSSWLDQAPKPLDVELEIRARGVKAIPLLLALAVDDALTEVVKNPRSDNILYKWRDETFEELTRPATRGELALDWLANMLPESVSGNRHRRKPRRELMIKARAFHEQYRDATDMEMALLEMSRPRGDFNVQAVEYALERARHGAVPELEDFLLGKSMLVLDEEGERCDDFTQGWRYDKRLDLGARYAAIRGESAQAFTKAFIGMLRMEATAGKIPKDRNSEKDAADLERFLLQTTLDDGWTVLKETGYIPPIGMERTIWEARLDTLPPDEAIRLLLVHAAGTPNAMTRSELADQLNRLVEKRGPTGLRPQEASAAWEVLIADDRVGQHHSATLVSDRYLALNEQFFANPPPDETKAFSGWISRWGAIGLRVKEFSTDYGPRGREWLRERVRQRLAGVPEAELPPFPADAAPDEETLAALRRQFAGVTNRAGAVDGLAGLSLPEYAALPEMLRRGPELNARLVALASRIERVTVVGDAGEWGEQFRAWEGQVPRPQWIEDLRLFCVEKAKEQQMADCRLSRKGDFGGCELRVETQPLPQKESSPDGRPCSMVGVSGLVCGPGIYGAAFWRTSPMGERRWWKRIPSDEYDVQILRQAVDTLFGSTVPATDEAFAVFQNYGE